MIETLRALVMGVWMTVHVGPLPPSAPAVADAIVEAVLFRSKGPPVFGSHAEDLIAMALWAERESELLFDPPPRSHDAKDGQSCGTWQEPCDFVHAPGRTLRDQARYWIWLLHEGKRLCPASPAADLSGGCVRGRPLADRRTTFARALLWAWLNPAEE